MVWNVGMGMCCGMVVWNDGVKWFLWPAELITPAASDCDESDSPLDSLYIISHIHVMGAAIADPPPSGTSSGTYM